MSGMSTNDGSGMSGMTRMEILRLIQMKEKQIAMP